MPKFRLDILVQNKLEGASRTFAASLIISGKVTVDGKVITKPGAQFDEQAQLVIIDSEQKYVSRAGYKLEHALQEFGLDPSGLIALDAGLSTGGFTDCLLQHGIAKVYGVDVGTSQVHIKVSSDPKVVVMEQTNLRELNMLPELVDLITLDLSFISLLKIVDNIKQLLKSGGKVVALIKPQFEVGKKLVGGGIIKDTKLQDQAVQNVVVGFEHAGFVCMGIIESSMLGGDGNREFLGLFTL